MNQAIIVGTVGITVSGIVAAAIKHKPVTPVVIGGYVAGIAASLLDLVGAGQVAGALMMAALVGVLLTEVPWSRIFGATALQPESPPLGPLNSAGRVSGQPGL